VLFDANADPSIMNIKGQSSLHLAARAGMEEVVKWLTEHCSRRVMDLRDIHGATATYYARAAGLNQRIVHRVATFEPDFTMVSGKMMEQKPHFGIGVRVPKWALKEFKELSGQSTPSSARRQSTPVYVEDMKKTKSEKPWQMSPTESMMSSKKSTPIQPKASTSSAMVDIKVDLEDAAVGRDVLLSKGQGNREIMMQCRKANQEHARLAWVQETEQKKHAAQIRLEIAKERRAVEKEREKHNKAHDRELARMKEEIENLKKLKAEAIQGQRALEELEKVREEIKEIKEAKFQALQLVQEIKEREEGAARRSDQRLRKRTRPGDQPKPVKTGYETFPDSPVEEQAWRVRHYGRDMPKLNRSSSRREMEEESDKDSDEDFQLLSKKDSFVPESKEDEAAFKIQSALRRSILKDKPLDVPGPAKGTTAKKSKDKDSSKGSPKNKAKGSKMKSMKSMQEERQKKMEADDIKQAKNKKRGIGKKKPRPAKLVYQVDPRTEEEIKAEQKAATIIQRRYRHTIVKQKLKAAPTEGTWALTKALRNQLAVRDYKSLQEKRRAADAEQLHRTYRSSIAEKILQLEDKSYAMKKQAEAYECVFRWEILVRGLQKVQKGERNAAAFKWVDDQRQKNPDRRARFAKKKPPSVESRFVNKYDLTGDELFGQQEKAATKIQSRVRGKQARRKVEAVRTEKNGPRQFTRTSSSTGEIVSVHARDQLDAALKAWCGQDSIDDSIFSKVYGKTVEAGEVQLLCHEAFAFYTHSFHVEETNLGRPDMYRVTLREKGEESAGPAAGHVGKEWTELYPKRQQKKEGSPEPSAKHHGSPKRHASPSPKRGVSPKRQPSPKVKEGADRSKSPKPKSGDESDKRSKSPKPKEAAAKSKSPRSEESVKSEDAGAKKEKKEKKEKSAAKKQAAPEAEDAAEKSEDAAAKSEDSGAKKQKKDKKEKKEPAADAEAEAEDLTAAAATKIQSVERGRQSRLEAKKRREETSEKKPEDVAEKVEAASAKKLKKEKKEKSAAKKEPPAQSEDASSKGQPSPRSEDASAKKQATSEEAAAKSTSEDAGAKKKKKDKKDKDPSEAATTIQSVERGRQSRLEAKKRKEETSEKKKKKDKAGSAEADKDTQKSGTTPKAPADDEAGVAQEAARGSLDRRNSARSRSPEMKKMSTFTKAGAW